MNKYDLAIWGTTPPPIGGMSVHIERLLPRLEKSKITYILYNFTSQKKFDKKHINISNALIWYIRLYLTQSPKIHYVITTRMSIRALAVIFGLIRRKKIIIRVGGQSFEKGYNSGFFNRNLSIFILKYCNAFIGVNSDICKLAKKYKNNSVYHIPGFIPPNDDGRLIPEKVLNFFEHGFKKIIVSGKILRRDEFDVYGLWDIINLCENIKLNNLKFQVCLFAYSSENVVLYDYLKEIDSLGLEKILFVFSEEIELWPSIKFGDIYLRPSYTDGDCNALREAIFFNKFVIATNVVSRPTGVTTYNLGDVITLTQILSNLENGISYGTSNVQMSEDNASKIIVVIKSLL